MGLMCSTGENIIKNNAFPKAALSPCKIILKMYLIENKEVTLLHRLNR